MQTLTFAPRRVALICLSSRIPCFPTWKQGCTSACTHTHRIDCRAQELTFVAKSLGLTGEMPRGQHFTWPHSEKKKQPWPAGSPMPWKPYTAFATLADCLWLLWELYAEHVRHVDVVAKRVRWRTQVRTLWRALDDFFPGLSDQGLRRGLRKNYWILDWQSGC